jgi:nitric oxide dioxygenase
MNRKQIELVQSSWRQVPYTLEQIAERFYTRLLEVDPATRRLFRGDMKEQGRRSMAMLTFMDGLTADVRAAWLAALETLAGTMLDAARVVEA